MRDKLVWAFLPVLTGLLLSGRPCFGQEVKAAVVEDSVILSSRNLTLSLSKQAGYGLRGIARSGGANFLKPDTDATPAPTLWAITVRNLNQEMIRVTNLSPAEREDATEKAADGRTTLRLTWRGIDVGPDKAALDVTVTVSIGPEDRLSTWRLSIANHSTSLCLWQVDFPTLSNITKIAQDDALAFPHQWGILVRDPTQRLGTLVGTYPVAMSMQFAAYTGGAQGLYIGTHDGNGYYKQLGFQSKPDQTGLRGFVQHFPADAMRPGKNYEVPYPVMIGVFDGDWSAAAAIYREWGIKQRWCAAGPLGKSRRVSARFKDISLWLKFYGEPAKVVPECASYANYFGTPMAVDWYRYSISDFDDNYPEFLPAKPHYRQGIRDLKDMGFLTTCYTNAYIWDTDTESWPRWKAVDAAVKNADGTPVVGKFQGNPNDFATMCAATPLWREKVYDTQRKLIVECGLDGNYLDQVACARAMLCYDPSHGHAAGGGNYWSEGYRTMMRELRLKLAMEKPEVALTTEGACEYYIDLFDAFLLLDATRNTWAVRNELIPMFTAVYHDYAITFGSDCTLVAGDQFFAWLAGLHFIHGSQMMLSDLNPPVPEARPDHAAYLRELVRCYHESAKKFLLYGQWLPPFALAVESFKLPQRARTITVDRNVPAVLHSVWRAEDGGVGIVMTNITDKPAKIFYNVRLDALGLGQRKEYVLTQAWPPGRKVAETIADVLRREEELPPRSARIYQLSAEAPAPSVAVDYPPAAYKCLKCENDGQMAIETDGAALWSCREAAVANVSTGDGARSAQFNGKAGRFYTLHREALEVSTSPPAAFTATVSESAAHGYFLSFESRDAVEVELRGPGVGRPATNELLVIAVEGEPVLVCRPGHSAPGGARIAVENGKLLLRQVRGKKVVIFSSRLPVSEVEEAATRSQLKTTTHLAQQLSATDMEDIPLDNAGRAAHWLHRLDTFVTRLSHEVERAEIEGPSAAQTRNELTEKVRLLYEALNSRKRWLMGRDILITTDSDWLAPSVPARVKVELTAPHAPRGSAPPQLKDARLVVEKLPVPMNVQLHPETAPPGARAFSVLVEDQRMAEHVLALRAEAVFTVEGFDVMVSKPFSFDVNRPLRIEFPAEDRKRPAVAGRIFGISVPVRNVSPLALPVQVETVTPAGWTADPRTADAGTIPGGETRKVAVKIRVADTATVQEAPITFSTTYMQTPRTAIVSETRLQVLPSLAPLAPRPASPEQFVPSISATPTRFRGKNRLCIHLEAGRTLRVQLANVKVTTYKDSVQYTLRDPDLTAIASGLVPFEKSAEINVRGQTTGTYYLDLDAKAGSCAVGIANMPWAVQASAEQPLSLIYHAEPMYFYVPPKAREFALRVRPGGPTELVSVRVALPDGREIVRRDNLETAAEIPVRTPEAHGGGVWMLKVDPMEDAAIQLSGDVCPYLSDHPSAVLIRSGDQR